MSKSLGIGDSMTYTDPKGVEHRGLIINKQSCRLLDTETGDTYKGLKFYLWNDETRRGLWTVGMRQSTPEQP